MTSGTQLSSYVRDLVPAILAAIEAEAGDLAKVEQVLVFGSAARPGYDPARSDIDLAVIVPEGVSINTLGIESALAQQFADRGLHFDVALVRRAAAAKMVRCHNDFKARVLMTGVPIWPDASESEVDNGADPALSHPDAMEVTAQNYEERATWWLYRAHDMCVRSEWLNSSAEVCCLAYMSACYAVAAQLVRHDLAVWPKAVRWRLDRLLQMLDWAAPEKAAHVARWAPILRSEYFVPLRQQCAEGFPVERDEATARSALAAAWRIARVLAPVPARRRWNTISMLKEKP